jgi:thioredoxin 1
LSAIQRNVKSMQSEKISKINQDDFQKDVNESPIPAVVDFYADWCPPCKMVSPILESLSTEYQGRVRFVKVNVDDNQELSSKYGIMSIPTVMFFVGGEVQDAIVGAVPATTYREKIEKAVKGAGKVA